MLRGILQDSEKIDENLTDDDDDIGTDNESESGELTFLKTSNNLLIASTVYFFIPDVLKHQKRTITIWIIIRSSHRRCSGKNGVLKNGSSESEHMKFAVKSLQKYLYRASFLVKLQDSSE